ncbi:pentapeptide repeat-containing protein [Streptomyces sp. NPDC012794]|uniref:pentapeptide repeat-containing protein n=1 Tax=Streptomyces sp. NPDC012794 TaxID=3364850 RepID=UPI0036A8FD35
MDVAGLDLSMSDLSGAGLANGLLTETVLRGARMSGADLYRAHLEGAVLDEADLAGASLVKAELDRASLRGAMLDGADFGSVEMYDVDARAASFRGAVFHGASLDDVDLRGADLSDASVSRTFMQVVFDDRTVADGLTGTVFGPAVVVDAEGRRELSGADLESWLNGRGAKVRVLPC